ncbi:MAG: nucleotidyltransferase family protein [Candidatus Paceibacterota bacterium]|jgi:bifunctional UDP-N-acetylglucosamine pyrophosphorylase/glucosamine-1-phosphate N-acetyltransferase
MQAVILAGGEGKRMRPLTLERPKPLVLVAGRPILEHIIDALPKEVNEIILVVGYKAEMIKQHFGDSYKDRRVSYVHQWMPAGTAHALSMAEPLLNEGRFVLLCADDLHGARAFEEALAHPLAILAARHSNPSLFGVLELTAEGTLASIVEKPEVPATDLISTGAMVLDTRIFQYETVRHENGEYYMTHPLGLFAKEHPIMVVKQDFWIPIGYPGDIKMAEEKLMHSR